jgi:hypothetical protein
VGFRIVGAPGLLMGRMAYIVAFIGVSLDFVTTMIGLNLGFHEAHAQYHPLIALAFFWTVIFVVETALSKHKVNKYPSIIFAVFTFIGAVHNTLVIMGVTKGLVP